MITTNKARQILGKEMTESLTNNEVQEIIDWLTQFAKIALEVLDKTESLS